ncbi:MAG: hypothetical protein ING03_09865 [Roseomonas sp.]|jgi:hypothetical protein|nr:hypothetical protein [Roseomonas sp.]MCA3316339.1 hypothetical protein [Roseomonas sp.]MCA3319961.1 hypothetical protein [Roseomonas sp.]
MTMPAASDNEAHLDRDLADIAQPIAAAAIASHPGWLCPAAMQVCPSRPI